MSRASRIGLALAMALGVAQARPDTAVDEPAKPAARAALAAQLADQVQVIDTTRATIGDKVSALGAVRLARLRAAYRVLRAPVPAGASAADRMADARKRAGARLLVERDRDEHRLLADELALLQTATERTIVATHALATIALPERLAWPAAGTIARHFGTIAHEKSKTTLARRGLDIEVETKTSAKASADGTVRYAGPIRGLDLGVIVDHGDYLTVVAKLGELAVPTGAKVTTGAPLGRAARHRIYLEVRVKVGAGGLPIDPEPLLVGESDPTSAPAAPANKSR